MNPLIDKKELAKRLQVTPRTIETWMKEKRLPYMKMNRSVRFDWNDVLESLKRNYGHNTPPQLPKFE